MQGSGKVVGKELRSRFASLARSKALEMMLRWKDIIYYAKYSNPEPARRVEKTEEKWQQLLEPSRYRILRKRETEPPYRNAYCRSYEPGKYKCAGCGSLLFYASEKYHAISGWPSFTQPATRGAAKYAFDNSHHMEA